MRTNFKNSEGEELPIDFHYPDGYEKGGDYPAMIWFYGGGWLRGSINGMEKFTEPFRQAGYICVCPQYRTKESHNATPVDANNDAQFAVKFVLENAEKFGINKDRLIGGGHSAGGQLISIMECNEEFGLSGTFKAILLSNPVINTGEEGFGFKELGKEWAKYCPYTNLKKIPPTIICHGEDDAVMSTDCMMKFAARAMENGCICQLDIFKDEAHGCRVDPRSRKLMNEKYLLFLKAQLLDVKKETLEPENKK